MDLYDKLKKYFDETPKEQVLKDWEETEIYDNVNSPNVEQFLLRVGCSLPNRNTVVSEIKKNLKEINEDKKVTNTDFDLGYSIGFFDGFDYKK